MNDTFVDDSGSATYTVVIKNDRQYNITKAQAEKFAKALQNLAAEESREGELHPVLAKAQQAVLQNQETVA